MKKLIISLFYLIPVNAFAQTGPQADSLPFLLTNASNFFIAVISGVLLALAFQLLLSLISFATGVTAIGNVEKKGHRSSSHASSSNNSSVKKTGLKIAGATGMWSVITATVSLFFASFLAIKLTLVAANFVGVVLGLVIWATFFVLLSYIEMKSFSTILGGIITTAMQGVRGTFSEVGDILSKSETRKSKTVAKKTVNKLRNQVEKSFDTSDIDGKIDTWVDKLSSREIDFDKARNQMAKLINNLEIESKTGHREMVLKVASEQPNIKKEDVEKLGAMYDDAKEAKEEGDSKADQAVKAVDKISPGSEENSQKVRDKISKYLRDSEEEDLQPARLKEDLNKMINSPDDAPEIAQEKLKEIDRNTFVKALSARKDISEEKAEKIVSNVMKAFDWIRSEMNQNGENTDFSSPEALDDSSDESTKKQAKDKAEGSIRKYINEIQGDEFDYDAMKRDLSRAFSDPQHSPEILRERMRHYDRESLANLLMSKTSMSEEQANKMIDKVEESKQEATDKITELERTVNEKIEASKQMALHQAENTRKIAASAAWWLVASAVISGAASALGGLLALSL